MTSFVLVTLSINTAVASTLFWLPLSLFVTFFILVAIFALLHVFNFLVMVSILFFVVILFLLDLLTVICFVFAAPFGVLFCFILIIQLFFELSLLSELFGRLLFRKGNQLFLSF